MKLLSILFLLVTCPFFSQIEVNIMSYNIRYGTAEDGNNSWENRKEKVIDLLNYHEASFIGLQEVQKFQLDEILKKMPDYAFIGLPRETGEFAEYSCILYHQKTFELIEQQTLWLSETPSVMSQGWDAACHRIITYGLFKNKQTKQHFWIANTHLDHMGTKARLESAKLISQIHKTLISSVNAPFILTGDFNASPTEESITFLKQNFHESTDACLSKPYGGLATWNGFDFTKKPERQIDYIFFDKSSKINVSKFQTITDFYDFKYPSDHFPILSTFIIH
jgi:endonuclease/exonuclease/phosphatase family metal-dependent hydrolase